MKKTVFNPEKMYTYIRGFASALSMEQTVKALPYAREKHNGQFRKSGEPYIVPPLTMACDAMSLGIKDDNIIATILLHDVCEDCGVNILELPVNSDVRRGVELKSYIKETREYVFPLLRQVKDTYPDEANILFV